MELDPALLSWMGDERLRKVAEYIILRKKPDEELLRAFKPADGLFFQHYVTYKDRRPRVIQMAPSYLLFVQGKFTNLIGIDEDTGKLFISGVDDRQERLLKSEKLTTLKMPYGEVRLFACEDADIREILGYDVDFRGGAVDLRGLGVDELRLRVQGDLLLVARSVRDVAEFAGWVIHNEELRRYVDTLFLDRVFGTLLEKGFSVRGWGGRIEVMGVTALRLKKFLAKWLRKYFTAVVEEDDRIELYDQELGHGYLTFDTICINLHLTKCGPVIDRLRAEAVEAFREVGRRRADLSFTVGRHRITVKSCLPNSIAFNPSIKPTYLTGERRRLFFSFGEIYAFAGETVITITHPEHERREVTFKHDAVVGFENTWVDQAFIGMRNRLLLRNLAKAGQEGEERPVAGFLNSGDGLEQDDL